MLTLFCLSKLNKNCNTLLFPFISELKSRNRLHQFIYDSHSFTSLYFSFKAANTSQGCKLDNFYMNAFILISTEILSYPKIWKSIWQTDQFAPCLAWHNFHTSSKSNAAFRFAAALFSCGKQEEGRTKLALQLNMRVIQIATERCTLLTPS